MEPSRVILLWAVITAACGAQTMPQNIEGLEHYPDDYGGEGEEETLGVDSEILLSRAHESRESPVFNLFDVIRGMAGRSETFAIGDILGPYVINQPPDPPINGKALLQYQAEDEKSQVLTLTLGVDAVPATLIAMFPWFVVEWGSGGAAFSAVLDAFPAQKINLVATFVRVTVVLNTVSLPAPVGNLRASASLGLLAGTALGFGLAGPHVTIKRSAVSPQTLLLPPFTNALDIKKQVPADVWTIDYLDASGTIAYSVTSPAGAQPDLPTAIHGNVNAITVTRTVGAGRLDVECTLSI